MGKTTTTSSSSQALVSLSRRDFVGTAAALAIPHAMRPPRPLPPVSRWAAKPVAVSSANGLRAVQKAFDFLMQGAEDRKSTRLNSSHSQISYAVFCLKKKKNKKSQTTPQYNIQSISTTSIKI